MDFHWYFKKKHGSIYDALHKLIEQILHECKSNEKSKAFSRELRRRHYNIKETTANQHKDLTDEDRSLLFDFIFKSSKSIPHRQNIDKGLLIATANISDSHADSINAYLKTEQKKADAEAEREKLEAERNDLSNYKFLQPKKSDTAIRLKLYKDLGTDGIKAVIPWVYTGQKAPNTDGRTMKMRLVTGGLDKDELRECIAHADYVTDLSFKDVGKHGILIIESL